MSKFVGAGPLSYEKRIYRAAVSQRLRNTALKHWYQYTELNGLIAQISIFISTTLITSNFARGFFKIFVINEMKKNYKG